MPLRLEPRAFARLHATLRVPSDKSITHRAVLLAAMADGETRIQDPLVSADTEAVLRCVQQLGASCEVAPREWRVGGARKLSDPDAPLDACNAGTGARLLLGLLAGQGVTATVTGDASLRRRPMDRVVEPLESMGARFTGADRSHLPLTCVGVRPLRPFRGRTVVPSAQVKSAILLAALGADGESVIEECEPTRAHTETMLPHFGVECAVHDGRIRLRGPAALRSPGLLSVPADPSSAAAWAAAAASLAESAVVLPDVLWHPRRTGFFALLSAMGANVRTQNEARVCGEPRATVEVHGAPLRAIEVRGRDVVDAIDELPWLAVVATQAHGRTVVRDAAELRVKESDRIAAIGEGLRALGADFEEFDDGFAVSGPVRLKGAVLRSHGDHRVAMALSLAALLAEGTSELHGEECVDVSYPSFFADWSAVLGDQGILRKV